jgi:hypothetical protein
METLITAGFMMQIVAVVILLAGIGIPLTFKKWTYQQYVKFVVRVMCISAIICVIPVIAFAIYYFFPVLHR